MKGAALTSYIGTTEAKRLYSRKALWVASPSRLRGDTIQGREGSAAWRAGPRSVPVQTLPISWGLRAAFIPLHPHWYRPIGADSVFFAREFPRASASFGTQGLHAFPCRCYEPVSDRVHQLKVNSAKVRGLKDNETRCLRTLWALPHWRFSRRPWIGIDLGWFGASKSRIHPAGWTRWPKVSS